jgi:hypothetical protein
LPADLLIAVTGAAARLSNGCQTQSAIDEVPLTVANDNLLFLSAVVGRGAQRLVLPQSAYERFNNIAPAAVQIDSALMQSAVSAGVSLLSFRSNPHGLNSSAGQLGLQVALFTTAGGGEQRRLQEDSERVGYSIALQNSASIRYVNAPLVYLSLSCDRPFQAEPYELNGVCSNVSM